MMKKVAVLMSTFNGQKYLNEQISSIIHQKGVDVYLYVRDDGSTDDTLKILRGFQADIKSIEAGTNLGPALSFMSLLYSVPDGYDYYALSDQDDIWNENKLQRAINMLESHKKILYASNQICVDRYGKKMGLKYSVNYEVDSTPIGIIRENSFTGCTMVMTNSMRKIICDKARRPSKSIFKLRLHDAWIAFVASLYDGIYYDSEAFIMYRQHENNVVGAFNNHRKFKERVANLIKGKSKGYYSSFAREACEKFGTIVDKYPLLKVCAYCKTLKQKKELIKHLPEILGDDLNSHTYIRIVLGIF